MTADNVQTPVASPAWTNAEPDTLMARVLTPANMKRAYQRVVSSKGAPGADGMTVSGLANHLKQHWPCLRARLASGSYHPQGIRPVSIPKPQGGERQPGIPCVTDRLLQQQLTPLFDPHFSGFSYGFRPGRSAHHAVEMARKHVAAGYRWCVEVDLEKFFDRVNHDILMAGVARRVVDKTVLRLIRRWLSRTVKLPVNREKSRYLGYSMSRQEKTGLRIAPESVTRLRKRLKRLLRGARGRKLADTIGELNPVLRGWSAYFSLGAGKSVAEGVDGWVT